MAGSGVVRRKRNGKTPRDRLREGEMMLRDRNAGMQVSDLMEKYSVSRATLDRRIVEAVASRIAPSADQYREEQNALLDTMAARWEQQLELAEDLIRHGQRTEALETIKDGFRMRQDSLLGIQRVSERRARLMGLDMPAKVEATVTVQTEADRELAQVVREAKVREHGATLDKVTQ